MSCFFGVDAKDDGVPTFGKIFLKIDDFFLQGSLIDDFVGRLAVQVDDAYVDSLFVDAKFDSSKIYNRVYGADAVFQFYNRLDISGYILQSDTPGREGPSQARKLAIGWRADDLSFSADYEKVEDDFNPEMGFIRRDDNSHYSGNFSYLPRLFGSDLIRNLTLPDILRLLGRPNGRDRDAREQRNLRSFLREQRFTQFLDEGNIRTAG